MAKKYQKGGDRNWANVVSRAKRAGSGVKESLTRAGAIPAAGGGAGKGIMTAATAAGKKAAKLVKKKGGKRK